MTNNDMPFDGQKLILTSFNQNMIDHLQNTESDVFDNKFMKNLTDEWMNLFPIVITVRQNNPFEYKYIAVYEKENILHEAALQWFNWTTKDNLEKYKITYSAEICDIWFDFQYYGDDINVQPQKFRNSDESRSFYIDENFEAFDTESFLVWYEDYVIVDVINFLKENPLLKIKKK